MTKNFARTLLLGMICSLLLLLCFIVVASAQEQKARPAHIGFIYPISSNGAEAGQHTNNFSFHVLAGISQQENAFCLSGVSNIVRKNAYGAMIAGLSNHAGGSIRGVQIAGFLNMVGEQADGTQIAGFANVSDNCEGAQVAGFLNRADNVDGAQVAGFLNLAKDAGAQVGGFANIGKDADVQIAGFSNISKNSEAVQLSGFINKTNNAGTQIAGFINIAKKVKGAQISGFINIAEECDYPIGLVNIVKNGEKQLGLTIDESGNTLAAFRSGGRMLYGILGAGYNFNEHSSYVFEGGIGAHLNVNKWFRVNIEAVATCMTEFRHEAYFKSSTRILAALKIANRLELFAGPSFNHIQFDRYQTDIRNDRYFWSHKGRNSFNGMFFGGIAGIYVNL